MYASILSDNTIEDIHASKMKAAKSGYTGELVAIDETASEALLTQAFNFVTGKNVNRQRNRKLALDTVGAYVLGGDAVKVSQRNKDPRPATAAGKVDLTAKRRELDVAKAARGRRESDVAKRKGIAVLVLELLQKNPGGYTAEQIANLLTSKLVTVKLAISHARTGRTDGTNHNISLDRKTGVYSYIR